MSRPGIKAFLSIENGLAEKLKAAWHKSAFEIFYQIQHALDRRDYHGAVQIARSISLEQIVKDNRAHMRLAAHAGLLFGATRITSSLKKTVVMLHSARFHTVVDDSVRQMEQFIRLNCEERVRDKLLEYIYQADLADPRTPFGVSKAEWLQKYDPDQPRAPAGSPDGGQWVAAGGDVTFSKDPKEAYTQVQAVLIDLMKKHYDVAGWTQERFEDYFRQSGWSFMSKQFERATGYYVAYVNFEDKEATLAKGTSTEEIIEKAKDTAEKLGWLPTRLDFTDEDYAFELDGKHYKAAGTAHLDNTVPGGRFIRIYTNQVTGASIDNVVAHEVGHQKFESAVDQYTYEKAKVMDAYKGKDIMKPSGELRDEYKAEFPIYTKWFAAYESKVDSLVDNDGVSEYSREWWDAHKTGKATGKQAFHETIAEMNALYVTTGKLPGAKVWKDFYNTVDELQIVASAGRGKYRRGKT